MRTICTSLLCIIFWVSGSFVSAAHTLAHIQPTAQTEVNTLHSDHHDFEANHDDDAGDYPSNHHDETNDSAEHSAELHLTMIDLNNLVISVAAPSRSLNVPYVQQQSPSPKLPPDPFPDRA